MQTIFLACNVAHPEVSDSDPEMLNLWDECYQAQMGLTGRPMYVLQVDNLKALRPPDARTAQSMLLEVVANELARLRELKKTRLDPLDKLDRDSAQERAMFDDSKEGVLLRRYQTACEREFHKSISDLMKLRKEAALRPAPGPEEAPLPNEAISEPPANQPVASNNPSPPEFEAVLTAAATPVARVLTPAGPVPAPD